MSAASAPGGRRSSPAPRLHRPSSPSASLAGPLLPRLAGPPQPRIHRPPPPPRLLAPAGHHHARGRGAAIATHRQFPPPPSRLAVAGSRRCHASAGEYCPPSSCSWPSCWPRAGCLQGIEQKPPNQDESMDGRKRKGGDLVVGRAYVPLDALFFSAFHSRAILDFWPLPPPMAGGGSSDLGARARRVRVQTS